MPHISKHFDAELDHIRRRILEMGGIVEYQIRYAVESLRNRNVELIETVAREELRVNRLQCEIDEECTQVIARRSPTAFDLRFLLMSMKTITDLERIGDEAKKIAFMSRELRLNERTSPGLPEIKIIANEVIEMLRMGLDELARMETSEVTDVLRMDREVDAQFKAMLRATLTYMIEDPRTISASLDALFVAKALERIGDHAKNIAEYVVYTSKGRDIRHRSLEEVEAATRD